MKYSTKLYLALALVLLILSACGRDEPPYRLRPVEQRQVLLITSKGVIYNQKGEIVTTLPDCKAVSQVTDYEGDWFACGTNTKDRVGYWKNGKWNTLHVDFIDDVDHWSAAVAKWDNYIYMLDYPNVLKNSGIFRLVDSEHFMPALHGLSVAEGKCYVVGETFLRTTYHNVPTLYTEKKGQYHPEILAMPDGCENGVAASVFAYDKTHFLVGGYVSRSPAIWVDRQLQLLPLSWNHPFDFSETNYPYGNVVSLACTNEHIYAAGFEMNDQDRLVATMWTDGVAKHYYACSTNAHLRSEVLELQLYGSDVYLLTTEIYRNDNPDPNDPLSNSIEVVRLWLNGELIQTYNDLGIISFTVI